MEERTGEGGDLAGGEAGDGPEMEMEVEMVAVRRSGGGGKKAARR